MAIIAALLFIGTCFLAYQLGQYDAKYGREDK
jgi:hypothetical protein